MIVLNLGGTGWVGSEPILAYGGYGAYSRLGSGAYTNIELNNNGTSASGFGGSRSAVLEHGGAINVSGGAVASGYMVI